MSRTVAVLGATGLVGRTMLALLEERAFPLERVRALASERSASRTIPFRGAAIPVEPVEEASFRDVQLALFACANPISQQWAPIARAAGACVIDNSSAFRYVADIPLVVPEVNGERLAGRPTLVANPNCSTIPVSMALAALRARARLLRVIVSTYQSVSGAGGDALESFERGIRSGLDGATPAREGEPQPIAYNVVPQIDRFESNGYSREEMKVVWELRKILEIPDLAVSATAVRVPVRVGHSASVHALLDRALDPDEARACWRAFPGIVVRDDPERGVYPTPLDAAGRDAVLVGRARRDLTEPCALSFFVASDNLRKGAALNAVQIAERWAGSPAPVT